MFTLQTTRYNFVNEDAIVSFSIQINYDGLTVDFSPEYPEMFVGSPLLENPHVNVLHDARPSNGECYVKLWDVMTFCIAKHGNGQGGSMILTIERTPERSEEFAGILRQIVAAIEAEPEIFSPVGFGRTALLS